MTENFAYTLRCQEPGFNKHTIYLLGIVNDNSIKNVLISEYDSWLLYMASHNTFNIETLNIEPAKGKYIWIETLQSGVILGKKPPREHSQFNNMVYLLEQVQFCAGNVQYLLSMAKRGELYWLNTDNIEHKLQALEKIVSRHNHEQINYIGTLRSTVMTLCSHKNQQNQPLLFSCLQPEVILLSSLCTNTNKGDEKQHQHDKHFGYN
jgi:hypothetical protein